MYAEANKKEKQASGSDVLGKQLASVLVKPESKPGNSCFLLLRMLQHYLFYSEEIDTTLTCLYTRNEQPGEYLSTKKESRGKSASLDLYKANKVCQSAPQNRTVMCEVISCE